MTVPTPADASFLLDDAGETYAPIGGGNQVQLGQVAGVNRVFNFGSAVLPWHGVGVFNTETIDKTTGDENYLYTIEGGTGEDVNGLLTGATVTLAQWAPGQVGQNVVALSNVYNDAVYQYGRLKIQMGGTTPQIQVQAFVQSLDTILAPTAQQYIQALYLCLDNFKQATTNLRVWATGVAGGGPDNDGKYPLSDGLGTTVNLPCPAQIAADIPGLETEVSNLLALMGVVIDDGDTVAGLQAGTGGTLFPFGIYDNALRVVDHAGGGYLDQIIYLDGGVWKLNPAIKVASADVI